MSAIIAAAAVTAGVGAYGAYSANKASKRQSDIAQQQQDLARALYEDSGPLRDLTQTQLKHFLDYGLVPLGLDTPPAEQYDLPTFMRTGELPAALAPRPLHSVPDLTAANRDVLESQFARAREDVVAQSPARGGQLASALASLEGQRALGVTGLYTQQNGLQYQQDLQEAQRQNQVGQALFGTGLDISRERQQQEAQLRRALFASALGVGTNQAGQALGGLANASTGFGNVASNALQVGTTGANFASDALGALLVQNRRRQTLTPYDEAPGFIGPPRSLAGG